MRGVVRRHVCEVVAVLLELMCIILMDIMFPALMCMGVKLKVLSSLILCRRWSVNLGTGTIT